jgi:two-component system LytT family sensor kinase
MNEFLFTSSEESLLKANLKYGSIGMVVGMIINVFTTVSYNFTISGKQVFINILFSVAITLSITNSVYLFERYLKPSVTSFWKYIGGFYFCNLAGMLIGTELSHFIISILYKFPYSFHDGMVDYRFNFFVVLVVGSLLLVYQAQKNSMQALLKTKELDLARAGQLKTEAELLTLQSKINPHFLYNSLNSIASLIHEEPDKAEEMTLKLSKLFRYSINTMLESFSTISNEIEILQTYLDIEKIRFGKRINFSVSIEQGLEDVSIPRFLIQPLAENALKHGLKDVVKNGLLSVAIASNPKGLMITVSDNGVPFPEELNVGYGLQSTYDKLKILYNENYELRISNIPDKAVQIIIYEKQ